MDSVLLMLDDGTDEATKQMLQNLIERKRKLDKLHKKQMFFLSLFFLYTFLFIYLFYKKLLIPYSDSAFQIISSFFDSRMMLLLLLAGAALLGAVKIFRDQKDKAEEEFHALRCEIIDKSKDLWKNDAWENRHKIFEMMERKFGINLYHESK
ncbi:MULTISPECIES: DUF2663 family protein [Bacillus]|uniref:DUF2663 family protein n=1 Tax=Bacillus smithii 7_3_47FAA TaxID=665952 RepID=G9QPA6_9BACI|nr:DUF2663 family protein [Bacillus smithii]AKP47628.1 hypothetical protein BSM4216_2388 [Bacillus smithii]EHL73899.1 hypothetical protein HMPREF1015_00123 [Bacillus smithii 7_3_47FAA]MED1487831.1 DUF2663 family protein [Bacillus smithii]MED4883946.1 DUF2663 family protein [Bacillus smithii]MED4926649.1 DUF2663 family protein [Bacillus smithii]